MQLIVGLGNPGGKYLDTRHNIGFMIVDALAQRLHLAFAIDGAGASPLEKLKAWFGAKALASTAKGAYSGHAFLLIKPLTYMNRSGEAVAHYVRALRLDLQDILIV